MKLTIALLHDDDAPCESVEIPLPMEHADARDVLQSAVIAATAAKRGKQRA